VVFAETASGIEGCALVSSGSHTDVIKSLLPLAPSVDEVFAPDNVPVGGASLMTITLSNANQSDDIVGVQLGDTYPSGLINASQSPVVCDTCGFVEDVPAGSGWANLTQGTIPAGGVCEVTIAVVGTVPEDLVNDTGAVTSSNAPDGTGASATLSVGLDAPTVSISFVPPAVSVGGTTQLKIELTNPNQDDITGVAFTDSYPVPLHMANASGDVVWSNTCGGNLDAQPGGGSVSLTDGMILGGRSCAVLVNVTGTSIGFADDHTGPVDSDNAQQGADASATLTITHFPLALAPVVAAGFSPDTNPNPAQTITGVQLDDLYPAGIVNASGNPVVSDDCDFTEDVPGDGVWARLSGGRIDAGASCSIVIGVVGTATATNDTGSVLSANAGTAAGVTATLTIDAGTPTVSCVLPMQVGIVGDAVSIDLSTLFAPPPGQSLTFGASGALPPSLSLVGSLLSGTLDTAGSYTPTLTASVAGGGTATENVTFDILPSGETIFLRDGFDGVPCP
jgi:hypothetical protein